MCAGDWGLYLDITTNLQVVLDRLGDYGLSEEETARVYGRVTAAAEAIEDEEKTRRWQLRARVGKRVAWRRRGRGYTGHADRHPTGVRPAARPEVAQADEPITTVESGPAPAMQEEAAALIAGLVFAGN